jgi:hypothetical protein
MHDRRGLLRAAALPGYGTREEQGLPMKRGLLALLLASCASAPETAPPFIPEPPPTQEPPRAAVATAPQPHAPALDLPAGPVTDYCRDRLERFIAAREESWASGKGAELDGVIRGFWEDCRRELDTKEADRVRQEEGKRQHDAAIAQIQRKTAEAEAQATDPKFAIPRLSADICEAQAKRAQAIREIAEEKRVARSTGGGVVDLKSIYQWQQIAADGEREEAEARTSLKAFGGKPLPCASRAVQDLL